MKQLQEHYSSFDSKQSTDYESLLAWIEELSMLNELDEVPIISDPKKALDQLPPGKATKSDEIPPDRIKQCQTAILKPIYY